MWDCGHTRIIPKVLSTQTVDMPHGGKLYLGSRYSLPQDSPKALKIVTLWIKNAELTITKSGEREIALGS